MGLGQNIAGEIASGLGRARQVLRDQLETLVGLAAIAVRMIESVAQAVADPAWPLAGRLANPMAGVVAVEKTLHGYARVSWALRLIRALRDKLLNDLRRAERGEVVDVPPPTQPAKAEAAKNRPATSMAAELAKLIAAVEADRGESSEPLERERPETESFGRYLSGRSGDREFAAILKRPTEEVIALIREALGVNEEKPIPLGGGRVGMGGRRPIRPRSEKTLPPVEPPARPPDSLHPHPRPFPLPQGEGG